MVALVGVAAGAVLGAAAYRFVPPSAAEIAQSPPVRSENATTAASKPGPPAPAARAAAGQSSDRPQRVASVTVVTPTPSSQGTAAKSGRQKTADILTAASIIRHAEGTRPTGLSAASARFGKTEPDPATAREPLPSSDGRQVDAIDKALTGSIAAPADGPQATVWAPEIDEMQSRLSKQNAEHFDHPADTVAAAAIARGMRMSEALEYVSLRALPDKTSTELAVVPAGAELLAETDCDRWCGAVYEGQDGYIYHIYLRVLEQETDTVEIAETEAEVVAIEARMAAQDRKHFQIPLAMTETAAPARSGSELREGWATKYVNLRAGPDNKSQVVTIVPADALVLAEENCRHWCRAVYDGRHGYIYKTYIRRHRRSGG